MKKVELIEEENEVEEPEESQEEAQESVKEDLERDKRTIFVGNVPIDSDKKSIIKHFKEYGKVEKMWVRSLPTDPNLKLTRKAKAITKKNIHGCTNKNCYILFAEEESVQKAIKGANNKPFENKHLHVTSGNHIERDFKTTIFVGNLPYNSDEEEIRAFFSKVGSVEYVRVIRDKVTFQSHGFCYVKFSDREAVLKALEISNKFKER